ncbi:MAG: hypothetical protein ONB32_13315 [candidate division KSB1 bacterium]|nr:hypothetical protein [candidate division KSB1 bacterium]MDZ7399689.1 hypothetical protein [candidate division KSB1 bacterium]
MRDLNKTHSVFVLFLSFLVSSCAVTHAPRIWLATPLNMQIESYGGWLEVKYYSNSKAKAQLSGELIAIGADSIFIANVTFHAIAVSSIKSARLVTYKSDAERMGVLVVCGTLSTFSNGFLLLITAPIWIIGGSIAVSTRSFEPILDYPKQPLSRFAPFARYPQGLPPGINRNQIKMKAIT